MQKSHKLLNASKFISHKVLRGVLARPKPAPKTSNKMSICTKDLWRVARCQHEWVSNQLPWSKVYPRYLNSPRRV